MAKKKKIEETTICPQSDDCVDTTDMPSLMDMAKNLMNDSGKIVSNALKGNQTLVSNSIREHRWDICQTCPELKDDRCKQCGCFMKVKVAFATSKCPLDKWN